MLHHPLQVEMLAQFTINLQFNEDGMENKFKMVQERINELNSFYLYNKDLSIIFKVDLQNGIISLGKTQKIESDLLKEKKNNIRLIFFRRHRVELSTQDLKEKKHEIIYFLGFQYLDKKGNNQKIIFQIDSEGSWVLGE